jgi:hypothetical protein
LRRRRIRAHREDCKGQHHSVHHRERALQFDEQGVRKAVSNIAELIGKLPGAMQKCLAYFAGCDRTVGGYEGLLS